MSSDATKVADQVGLNVNFFLRNLVQAIGTLIFMFWLSWRLSVVAFVSVPLIVFISKVSNSAEHYDIHTLIGSCAITTEAALVQLIISRAWTIAATILVLCCSGF